MGPGSRATAGTSQPIPDSADVARAKRAPPVRSVPKATRSKDAAGTKNQALPDVPSGVRERVGRRADLPPVQVDRGLAFRLSRPLQRRDRVQPRMPRTSQAVGSKAGRATSYDHLTTEETSLSTNRGRRPQQRRQQADSRQPHGGPNHKANWQRLRDHYLLRARAALDGGDRIEAENFYQHADHYFRLIQGTAA